MAPLLIRWKRRLAGLLEKLGCRTPPQLNAGGVGRQQLIADVINNSDHITINTNTPTRVSNTTLQQTSSQDITSTYCTTGHGEQLNTHYHQTIYLSSLQLTYDRTTDYNKTDGISPTTRNQHTHCQQNVCKHYTDGRLAQHTKGQDA